MITGFDAAGPNPLQRYIPSLRIPGEIVYAGTKGAPLETGDPLSVQPAITLGLGYAVNSKTVVRGGYNILWQPTPFGRQSVTGFGQTTSVIASTNNYVTPATTISNPYPGGLLKPTGNTLGGLSGIRSSGGIAVADRGIGWLCPSIVGGGAT